MQDYKKLKVWEHSHQFTIAIYKLTKQFPKEELFALTSQIRRASSSIPANIAEGCGRRTQADLTRFLNIALGSANEVSYFLLLAKDIDYMKKDVYLKYEDEIEKIKAMLISLISKTK